MPWYCSDIYDGFHIQSISAVLFIYLGCITNAITFGGLLGDATDNYQVFIILMKDCTIISQSINAPVSVHMTEFTPQVNWRPSVYPLFLSGCDGEFPWHCFSRNCLLFVWRTTSHHPQFYWTHSHLWKTALWIHKVRLIHAKTHR